MTPTAPRTSGHSSRWARLYAAAPTRLPNAYPAMARSGTRNRTRKARTLKSASRYRASATPNIAAPSTLRRTRAPTMTAPYLRPRLLPRPSLPACGDRRILALLVKGDQVTFAGLFDGSRRAALLRRPGGRSGPQVLRGARHDRRHQRLRVPAGHRRPR